MKLVIDAHPRFLIRRLEPIFPVIFAPFKEWTSESEASEKNHPNPCPPLFPLEIKHSKFGQRKGTQRIQSPETSSLGLSEELCLVIRIAKRDETPCFTYCSPPVFILTNPKELSRVWGVEIHFLGETYIQTSSHPR